MILTKMIEILHYSVKSTGISCRSIIMQKNGMCIHIISSIFRVVFRTTGVEVLDIIIALFEAHESLSLITDPEVCE